MRTSAIKKNHKIYIFKHQQTSSGGGGGADLEDNKTATIDVSAYTGPVTINPSAGKDGMKKATVTLSNIPSGGTKLFAWKTEDISVYTLTENPSIGDTVLYKPYNDNIEGTPFSTKNEEKGITTVKSVTENQIETTYELNSSDSIFTRYSDGDIEF